MSAHIRAWKLLVPASLLATVVAPSVGLTAVVTCSAPNASIQKKIPAGTKPVEIVIRGVCNGHVTITRDDVTLKADPLTGGAINGTDSTRHTVVVDGGRNVVIDGLSIGGGRHGVVAVRGGSVTVQNAALLNNAGTGAVASSGASVTVVDTEIAMNGSNGVVVTDTSRGVVIGSRIHHNAGTGIAIQASSSARIGVDLGGVPSPNVIENNGGHGVSVFQASQAVVRGNEIAGNAWTGVGVVGSAATVVGNAIRNSGQHGVAVGESGTARIGLEDPGNGVTGNTIEGSGLDGVQAGNGASALLAGNTIRTSGRFGVQISRSAGRLLGGNTIETSAEHGVVVSQGSLLQGQGDFAVPVAVDTIQDNGRSGLLVFNGASAELWNAVITGNNTTSGPTDAGILLTTHASLQMLGSSVTGNSGDAIRLSSDSGARFQAPPSTVTATGNAINCLDAESSVSGTGNLVVTGAVICTGF
jgi:hypothetical protein